MENLDFTYICTVIGNLAGIPIRIFQNSTQVFYRSVVSLPKDPMTAFQQDILSVDLTSATLSLLIFIIMAF